MRVVEYLENMYFSCCWWILQWSWINFFPYCLSFISASTSVNQNCLLVWTHDTGRMKRAVFSCCDINIFWLPFIMPNILVVFLIQIWMVKMLHCLKIWYCVHWSVSLVEKTWVCYWLFKSVYKIRSYVKHFATVNMKFGCECWTFECPDACCAGVFFLRCLGSHEVDQTFKREENAEIKGSLNLLFYVLYTRWVVFCPPSIQRSFSLT